MGTLLVAVTGPDKVTSPALHAVRSALVRKPGIEALEKHAFCWIVDFPLFEQDAATGEWTSRAPSRSPRRIPTTWRGSRRRRALPRAALRRGVQRQRAGQRLDPDHRRRSCRPPIFELLRIPADDIRRRFGFLLDALAGGAPPHGGFALGFDRIAMLLAGATNLRDVIAFPKTTTARALFEGAPTPIDPKDLAALHLEITREG